MNIFIALLFLSKCRNKLKCLSAGLIHLHKDMIFISSNDTGWDEVKEASYKERHSRVCWHELSSIYSEKEELYLPGNRSGSLWDWQSRIAGFHWSWDSGEKIVDMVCGECIKHIKCPPFAHIRWGNCLVGLSPVTWMPGIRPDWLLGDPTIVTDAKQSTVSCEGNLCEQLHGICVGTNQERKWGEAAREKVGLKRCADEVVLRSCWLCFAVG